MTPCKVKYSFVYGGHELVLQKEYKFPCPPFYGSSIADRDVRGNEVNITFNMEGPVTTQFYFETVVGYGGHNNETVLTAEVRGKMPTEPDLYGFESEIKTMLRMGWEYAYSYKEKNSMECFLSTVADIAKVPYK